MKSSSIILIALALVLNACKPSNPIDEFHSFDELKHNKVLRDKLGKVCIADGRHTDTCKNVGHAMFYCMDGATKNQCDER